MTFGLGLSDAFVRQLYQQLHAAAVCDEAEAVRYQRAYCIGLPRSGTHTVAAMTRYGGRSAHEPAVQPMLMHLLNYLYGNYDRGRMMQLLRYRDRWLGLQLESAHYLHHVAALLLECWPDARFILTVREPRQWLISEIRQNLLTRTLPIFRTLEAYRYGRYDECFTEGDESLAEIANLHPVRAYLRYWSDHIEQVLDTIPGDRLQVVDTYDLGGRTQVLAEFLGFAVVPVSPQGGHGGQPFDLGKHVNPGYLRDSIIEITMATQQRLTDLGISFGGTLPVAVPE
jgi:hypothetical protein